ncbi:MAG: RNA polymerase sigma factor [Clostridia bacterium]|nr:RNA polymerase sigma factor [Clostridia bacterium]
MNFDVLYTACFHKLYRFAMSLIRSPSEAEEIVQETFFWALRNADKFPENVNIDAWLFRVARNIHISRLRRRQHEADGSSLEAVPSGDDVETRLADKDQAQLILTALHTLPEPYKEVFTLRALGDVPYGQIASLFGKGESWARVTYHRARLMLTDMTQKEDQDEPS